MIIFGGKEFYTAVELANMLQIDVEEIIFEIKNRTLEGINFEGNWLIPKTAVYARIKNKQKPLFEDLKTKTELPLFSHLKSKVISTDSLNKINIALKDALNKTQNQLSKNIISSTRAVGDLIKNLVAENIENVLLKANVKIKKINLEFSRRSIRNLSFIDESDINYYVITVTSREDSTFSMPNIVSVERLDKLYSDKKIYFCVILISYSILEDNNVSISKVNFMPIEAIDWKYLNIAALGWAQIQIKNKSFKSIKPNLEIKREDWMIKLCDLVLDFYEKEIQKIKEVRVARFMKSKNEWLRKIRKPNTESSGSKVNKEGDSNEKEI